MDKDNNAVVVFSGGQDSTTCLLWALRRFDKVIAVTFNYNQRHKLEIECAKNIAKDLGEDVSAALEGEVIYAGYNNGGYGNLIILQHNNNMKTYYAHLSNIYVSVGEIVKKNDLIGAIGSTGNSTGPHLHFELRVDNNPVNPIKYIQQ